MKRTLLKTIIVFLLFTSPVYADGLLYSNSGGFSIGSRGSLNESYLGWMLAGLLLLITGVVLAWSENA